jgi:hypothetical protein
VPLEPLHLLALALGWCGRLVRRLDQVAEVEMYVLATTGVHVDVDERRAVTFSLPLPRHQRHW